MGEVRVNSSAFVYTVDNPQSGQPPLARAAHHGEVITLDAEQEKRGRAMTVNVDYPVGNTTVRATEPALVDVAYDSAGAALDAAKAARRAQLTAELEALGDGPVAVPVLLATTEDTADAPPAPTVAPPAPPAPPKASGSKSRDAGIR